MEKINMMGMDVPAQMKMMEDVYRDASYPNTFEFLVEYVDIARMMGNYAIMHGYRVTGLTREHQFKFYLTVEADQYRKDTLMDEVVAASDVNFDTPYIPAFVGRGTTCE